MKRSRVSLAIPIMAWLLLLLTTNTAYALIDPASAQVSLEKDCGGADNCFDTWDDLALWIEGTRNPNQATPLTVNIGPGEFVDVASSAAQPQVGMLLQCSSATTTGWIKFQGAGRDQTRLTSTNAISLWIIGCEALEFQDLTIEGSMGVGWNGPGSSTWTNVNFSSDLFNWFDACSPELADDAAGVIFSTGQSGLSAQSTRSEHYYFNIKQKKGAFISYCATNWIYGSDITSDTGGLSSAAIIIRNQGDVRVFGSTVRGIPANGSTANVVGISIRDSGQFHMHGGIINVDSSSMGSDAIAILMNDNINGMVGSLAHVIDTAFVLKSNPAAQTIRIHNDSNGKVMSPFLWQPGTNPPGNNLASTIGQDLFVEQDCDSTGDCSGSCTTDINETCQPHMMIYNDACIAIAGSPWFDSTVNQCRQN